VKSPPSNYLVWFGVLGGGIAWAVQFVANLGLTFAQCDQPVQRWALSVHDWEIGLSAAAVAVGLAATAVSVWLFVRTYRHEDAAELERQGMGVHPPLGRLSFLSMVGITVNVLAITIIVMTGIGAPLLPVCQQS
jgi:hypothetical protein